MNIVTVESVIALSADQKNELKSLLTKKLGKEYELVEKLEPSVLGGIRLTIGSKRIDLSLSGRLEQVKQQLMND